MEENKNVQLHVHNFNSQTAPQYTERVTRAGYVSYGEDNLYPDYLISLMNCSAKHNAILKRKSQMIAGNGWSYDGLDAAAINLILNPYNEMDLNDIAFRSSYDLELFGAFALEIIYSKDRSKIAEVNYIPVNKVRLSECGDYVYYSNDWTNTRKHTPVKYSAFNPKNPVASQILYVKEYRPGVEYYGQPEYLSCVNWIELEYEISLFHLNQVKNGFAPSMVINFTNGVPSDDEMRDVIRQLQNDFEGARNAGKVMFLFSDGQDRAAQITPITLNDSDERFVELNKEITQGILTGHSITNPIIMGIAIPGSLGAKDEIIDGIEALQALYINPKQQFIERVFNRLAKFNGSQTKLTLNKYELDIDKIEGEE